VYFGVPVISSRWAHPGFRRANCLVTVRCVAGPPAKPARPAERLIEVPSECGKMKPDCLTELPQFDNVEATFTALTLANKRLRLIQSSSHVNLCQSVSFAGGAQFPQKKPDIPWN